MKGKDPAADRQKIRQSDHDTVEHFVRAFIERYAKKQQRSWRETERTLLREFTPRFGKKRLTDISRRDIAQMVDQIMDRAPVMARRTFAYVRRFFNWCIEQGFLDVNPCAGLKPPSGGGERERVLSDNELAIIWKATEILDILWESVFKFLILTAQRKNEVIGMEWAEIDEKDMIWRIPGRRTKNARAHEVPLSLSMLKILQRLPRIEGSQYVFSTNGKQPMAGQSRVKRELDVAVNALSTERSPSSGESVEIPHWTTHDLRRTATTGMARLGVPPHVADSILNHKSGTVSGVAAVYNRYSYLEERREALEKWESHVSSLIEAEQFN